MGEIFQKIAEISKEVGSIGKDNKNKDQGFSYRSIEQIVNALHPIMSKHGVFVVPMASPTGASVTEYQSRAGNRFIDRCIFVTYRLYATDGSFVEGTVPGEGSDSSDKASNKCMSASLKYFLAQVFMIPTQMDDGDAESHERAESPKAIDATPSAEADDLDPMRKKFKVLMESVHFTDQEKAHMRGEVAKVKDNKPSVAFLVNKWVMDEADRRNKEGKKLDDMFKADEKAIIDPSKDILF